MRPSPPHPVCLSPLPRPNTRTHPLSSLRGTRRTVHSHPLFVPSTTEHSLHHLSIPSQRPGQDRSFSLSIHHTNHPKNPVSQTFVACSSQPETLDPIVSPTLVSRRPLFLRSPWGPVPTVVRPTADSIPPPLSPITTPITGGLSSTRRTTVAFYALSDPIRYILFHLGLFDVRLPSTYCPITTGVIPRKRLRHTRHPQRDR